MYNRRKTVGPFIFGGLLILWGVLILISQLLHIDFWAICWPAALILIGVWLLLRPRLVLGGAPVNIRPLADIRRSGVWSVSDEEIWTFVGDTRLDMTQAEIPPGETVFRVYGFVGDVILRLPPEVGLSISSQAFLTESRMRGEKQDTFLSPYEYNSPEYESAERKLRLETYFFVVTLKIYQA